MRSLRTILLATDLYQTGEDVFQVAARLSQLFEARTHLLHVVKRHSDLHVADFPMTQRATDQLNALKDRLSGMGVDAHVLPTRFGDPAEVIRQEAESLDVDLVLIGTGPSGSENLRMVGPVAEGVIQRCRQPVLAVHPGTTPDAFQRLLCPVDHSATSRRGLKNAIRLAQTLESELIVLSVVPDIGWLAAAVEAGEFRNAAAEHERRWREEFDHFLQPIEFGGVSWRRVVRMGKPAVQIDQAALEERVGLMVIGATGRTGLIRVLLGSVTRAVLRNLPCSILVVKDENVIDAFTEEDARLVELLFAEGQGLLDHRFFDAAVAKFDQVLAHHPFHVEALLGRAEALENLGEPQRAARSRERAHALHRPLVD
jgi:nucleotide-binding universal stress UspA family protein